MSSTNIKSIARRIAKLEALSTGPAPEHWRRWRWNSRAPFQPSIHLRFGYLRRLPENHRGERQARNQPARAPAAFHADPRCPYEASPRVRPSDRCLLTLALGNIRYFNILRKYRQTAFRSPDNRVIWSKQGLGGWTELRNRRLAAAGPCTSIELCLAPGV